jgi:hypothetical protein
MSNFGDMVPWFHMPRIGIRQDFWLSVPIDAGRGGGASITGCMPSSGSSFGGAPLAQAAAAKLRAVGLVNEAMEDGIGKRRSADPGHWKTAV